MIQLVDWNMTLPMALGTKNFLDWMFVQQTNRFYAFCPEYLILLLP
jgi:hypothetical protein